MTRQRQPRLLDPGYLAYLRQQPCCCGCGQPPPCDAAHLRFGSVLHGKPACTGMARKPDDQWAVPLKHGHHMAQHATGDEALWWSMHGVDPFAVANRLYREYGGTGGKPSAKKAIKPRKPRGQRAKLKSRNTFEKRK